MDIAFAALWFLTIVNSLLLILVLRQLTLVVRGGEMRPGPAKNTRLPEWSLTDLSGNIRTSAEFAYEHVLLVVSEPCEPCRALLKELGGGTDPLPYPLVVAFDGTAEEARARTEWLSPGSGVVLQGAGAEFKKRIGIPGTPHAVALRADGLIAASGVVNTREHLDALMRQLPSAKPQVASAGAIAGDAPRKEVTA